MRNYRGKRIDNGEWVYGWLYQRFAPRTTYQELGLFISWFVGDCLHEEEVHPDTVGQSTGLKDTNGKEIFEGDKVRHSVHRTDGSREWTETEEYEVKWSFIRWSIPYAFLPWGKNPKIEIIGTIHDKEES